MRFDLNDDRLAGDVNGGVEPRLRAGKEVQTEQALHGVSVETLDPGADIVERLCRDDIAERFADEGFRVQRQEVGHVQGDVLDQPV